MFGKEIEYTRTISTSDITYPKNEHSLIWIETEPILKEGGTADPASTDYTAATIGQRDKFYKVKIILYPVYDTGELFFFLCWIV